MRWSTSIRQVQTSTSCSRHVTRRLRMMPTRCAPTSLEVNSQFRFPRESDAAPVPGGSCRWPPRGRRGRPSTLSGAPARSATPSPAGSSATTPHDGIARGTTARRSRRPPGCGSGVRRACPRRRARRHGLMCSAAGWWGGRWPTICVPRESSARCASSPGSAARCASSPGSAARCASSPGSAARCASSPGSAARCASSPGSAARCASSPGSAARCASSPGSAARCASSPGSAARCASSPGSAARCASSPGARCAGHGGGTTTPGLGHPSLRPGLPVHLVRLR